MPTPIIGWGDDTAWLAARRTGITASEVAAILGYSNYQTPWGVWMEKTGGHTSNPSSHAIDIGVALEPWLIAQAAHNLGCPVRRTTHRLYANTTHPWMLASPDAEAHPEDGEPYGVEAKTAGIAGGFGPPTGWADGGTPLTYQFQAHWQMAVMGWRKVVIVALVANMGLLFREILRDPTVEAMLAAQVGDWHRTHMVGGVEPNLTARDNSIIDDMYTPTGGTVILDGHPTAAAIMAEYAAAQLAEKAAKKRVDTAAAELKHILGDNTVGTIDDKPVITWKPTVGRIGWKAVASTLAADAGLDLNMVAEAHRGDPTRILKVKP